MDIYTATKAGDIERVKYLVEEEDVDLNKTNEFNSIPLFYACLCGHTPVVLYLLEKGSICDPGTFEGERCHYAALTPEIRDILETHKAKPVQNKLVEHMRKVLKSANNADITFTLTEQQHGTSKEVRFSCHKWVLQARSKYFENLFQGKAKHKTVINLNNKLRADGVRGLLEYLYTNGLNVPQDAADSLRLLCRQCRLPQLEAELEQQLDTIKSSSTLTRVIIVGDDPKVNFDEKSRSMPPSSSLAQDMWDFVRRYNRFWLENDTSRDPNKGTETYQVFETDRPHHSNGYADVCLLVDGVKFWCHRSIFSAQSEYFASMFSGRFKEGTLTKSAEQALNDKDTIPEITINDTDKQVFSYVVQFVYTNLLAEINDIDLLVNILAASDHFLLQHLKNAVARQLIHHCTTTNVLDLLCISKMFHTTRLLDHCVSFIEENFEELQNEEFDRMLAGDKGEDIAVVLKKVIKEREDMEHVWPRVLVTGV